MSLNQKIIALRKAKGITQEELAESTKVSVRTIQRIENGEGIPRSFTLKRISEALQVSYAELNTNDVVDLNEDSISYEPATISKPENKYFLRLLCLSCFSYIVIPYIHFLIPMYLMKKKLGLDERGVQFSKKVILSQIYWVISMLLLFLFAIAYNFIQASYFSKQYILNYFWIFIAMYLLNAFIIFRWMKSINSLEMAAEEK
jgi:XRE family transcriptional regulator, regulator of sulfur utilization